MNTVLFVGIGGFLGANLRYLLSTWITDRLETTFPLGTFFVNFTGSLLLAVFIVWAAQHVSLPSSVRLLIGTGFFGAYTTFSTFANETVALFQAGDVWAAVSNVIANNVFCLLGVLLGLALASRLFTG